jgi:hypothetical protein
MSIKVHSAAHYEETPFTFALFTWEFVQHEAIHHGQWSVYASLAGFDTPLSWRMSAPLTWGRCLAGATLTAHKRRVPRLVRVARLNS